MATDCWGPSPEELAEIDRLRDNPDAILDSEGEDVLDTDWAQLESAAIADGRCPSCLHAGEFEVVAQRRDSWELECPRCFDTFSY